MTTIYDFLFNYDITEKLLDSISIETKLNVSLIKDLNHFNKNNVINELNRVILFYLSFKNLGSNKYDYRIKAINSIIKKFDKYFAEGRQFKKVFDDIVGFRIICKSYEDILKLDKCNFRVVDMSKGKRKNDDGYRGIHLYYQKSNKHYPIEIQIFTSKDKKFNEWIHEYLYKRDVNANVGKYLKSLYDSDKIKNNLEFKEALNNVLRSGKKIQ